MGNPYGFRISSRASPGEGMEAEPKKQGLYNSWVPKINVGNRNNQMLRVTALKFKSWMSFGVASNPQ